MSNPENDAPGQFVVAIDGPAGAGKSTVAERLAQELGCIHLNSGALYRGVTLLALRQGVALDDAVELARLSGEATMDFGPEGAFQLNGEDASEAVRTIEVDEAVSHVSVHRKVRQAVTAHQRRIARDQRVVVEGRDVTTVVFPDASVKFYLRATVEERARRRYAELHKDSQDVTLDDVRATIRDRDERDKTRKESPLRSAPDAHVVDTTELTIEEVVERMAAIARERIALHASVEMPTCQGPDTR